MPKRTKSHVCADRALSAVIQICANCGWAFEIVQADYGEDLLVQTKLRDEVDPYRLCIQVKGTERIDRYRSKGNEVSYLFPSDHVQKWVRSPTLAVVVLWDVSADSGYFVLPSKSVDMYDLTLNPRKNTRLYMRPEDRFDNDGASSLAWTARLHHYDLLFAKAAHSDYHNAFMSEGDPKRRQYAKQSPLLACELLRRFNIFPGSDEGDRHLAARIKSITRNFQDRHGDSYEDSLEQVIMLWFVKQMNDLTGQGVPPTLIPPCTAFIRRLVETVGG